MLINRFVTTEDKKKIDHLNFSPVNARTNIFITIADSQRKVEWSLSVPESNFVKTHPVASTGTSEDKKCNVYPSEQPCPGTELRRA